MQRNALIRAEKESSSLRDLKHRHPGAAPGAPQPSCACKLLVLKTWSGRVDLKISYGPLCATYGPLPAGPKTMLYSPTPYIEQIVVCTADERELRNTRTQKYPSLFRNWSTEIRETTGSSTEETGRSIFIFWVSSIGKAPGIVAFWSGAELFPLLCWDSPTEIDPSLSNAVRLITNRQLTFI